MANAKGRCMRPGGGWQPGCQPSRQLSNGSAVATWLPLQESAPDGAAVAGLISNGNQVATQEGR